jgi:hypothetical protein
MTPGHFRLFAMCRRAITREDDFRVPAASAPSGRGARVALHRPGAGCREKTGGRISRRDRLSSGQLR